MGTELARIVANTAWQGMRLGHLVPILKEHCSEEDYEVFGKGIARVLAEISAEVLTPLYARFPELQEEFDRNAQKYGVTS